jgi:hypothetical protein
VQIANKKTAKANFSTELTMLDKVLTVLTGIAIAKINVKVFSYCA